MPMTNNDDPAYISKHEGTRSQFQETLERLHHDVKFNIDARAITLATKDLKLLRSIDASLTYLLSKFEKDWKICLPKLVTKYVDSINAIYEETKRDNTHEGLEDFLSICDVAVMLDNTDDIIHYLITEYDPGAFYQRRNWASRIMIFMNSARSVTQNRRDMARKAGQDRTAIKQLQKEF